MPRRMNLSPPTPISNPPVTIQQEKDSPPPPKLLRPHRDPQLPHPPRRQMRIERPLHPCPRLPHTLHALQRQTQNLRQQLAYLELGVAVLGRELQDLGQSGSFFVAGVQVLGGDVLADAADVLGVGGVALRPVVHRDVGVWVLRLPDFVEEDVDGAFAVVGGAAVEDGHAEHDPEMHLCRLL